MNFKEMLEDKILCNRIINFYRNWVENSDGQRYLKNNFRELYELHENLRYVKGIHLYSEILQIKGNGIQKKYIHDLQFGISEIFLLVDSILGGEESNHKIKLLKIFEYNKNIDNGKWWLNGCWWKTDENNVNQYDAQQDDAPEPPVGRPGDL